MVEAKTRMFILKPFVLHGTLKCMNVGCVAPSPCRPKLRPKVFSVWNRENSYKVQVLTELLKLHAFLKRVVLRIKSFELIDE